MIDDVKKSLALTEKLLAALPVQAIATKELIRTLQQEGNGDFPLECIVTEVRYIFDEGGISCHLDFGSGVTENIIVVSITHLKFYRKDPLTREIEAYCKHRIKRLKKLNR